MNEREEVWAKDFVQRQRKKSIDEDQIVYLNHEELRKVEPDIGPVRGALYFPHEGNIDPQHFTKSMGEAATELGARDQFAITFQVHKKSATFVFSRHHSSIN